MLKCAAVAYNNQAFNYELQNDQDNSLFLLDNDPNGNMTQLDVNMLEDFEANFETAEKWEETPAEAFNESSELLSNALFR